MNVRVVAEWEQTKPDATKGIVQKSGDFSASLSLRGRSPTRLPVPEEPQTTILPDPHDSGLPSGCSTWIFLEPSPLFMSAQESPPKAAARVTQSLLSRVGI